MPLGGYRDGPGGDPRPAPAGAKADATCGIHIHVGLGQHTPASLRRLVNLVNAKEDLLTQALGISPGGAPAGAGR